MTVAVDRTWTPHQQAALDAVADWYRAAPRDDKQVFRLFGYAGTGKTTLARACGAGIGGLVLYGCFTGKAALVLRQKGCLTARTIHSLIYQPFDKSAATLVELKEAYSRLLATTPPPAEKVAHELKCRELADKIYREEKSLKQPAFQLNADSDVLQASLVIIDEVSMVGDRMGRDLLSFEKPILVIGDPAQLPPVADGGFFTEAEPDVMLTEVHRQAADSPVIQLATEIRAGRRLSLGTYGDSAVIKKGSLPVEEIAKGFDQVLCGRNLTRRLFNRRVRESVLGRTSPYPEPGDRVVCLRNNHDLGLLNGSLWTVKDVYVDEKITMTLLGDEGGSLVTEAHKAPFDGEEVPYFERRDADEFDYGYALTVHKAQGSQWRSVYVIDESGAFREHARRWLYTGITRAAERVTVAQ